MPLVFGLSTPEDEDEDNDNCLCSGIEDAPPPNLTLSVLFLIVGVPEREMGGLCTVDDGLLMGSDAFGWSSSRNADASPPPPPTRRRVAREEEEEEVAVLSGPTLSPTPIPTEESGGTSKGVEEDSRSSRSRSASWYFAMD